MVSASVRGRRPSIRISRGGSSSGSRPSAARRRRRRSRMTSARLHPSSSRCAATRRSSSASRLFIVFIVSGYLAERLVRERLHEHRCLRFRSLWRCGPGCCQQLEPELLAASLGRASLFPTSKPPRWINDAVVRSTDQRRPAWRRDKRHRTLALSSSGTASLG
jgi:hypothetical protein